MIRSRMDEASLLLGITGTGGVIGTLIFYLVSKGFRSNCMAMKMEMNVDVHQVKEEGENPNTNILQHMTRSELEEIIVDTIRKNNTRRNSDQSYSVNIVMPNALKPQESVQQSEAAYMKEMEDAIKDRIMFMDLHDTPDTRSRSESEGSHKSHKSHLSHKSSHSKHQHKEEHAIIIREQL